MKLTDPIRIGDQDAPNRLLFGPHETNLARGRAISDRHVAYYARRARGGAGIIVTEEASVHPSDWPYERAPLATECGSGWRDVAETVHAAGTGTLVLAALGHAGGQGSSAYSQTPLWAPSRVPEVNSREVPKWMEAEDIDAVIDGFGTAARLAAATGLDGVEINAGQNSLVRQFCSGLTNHRGDEWGTDGLAFATEVLTAARKGLASGVSGGSTKVLGLRLSCDEIAPWAGLTAEMAAQVAVTLGRLVDYLVVVRGSIFTASATRPDFHEPAGFNRELCASIRTALRDAAIDTPVVLQGSIVDTAMADDALEDGTCDLVEMTRAQIADPALGVKVAAGRAEEIRPCVLCNQLCQVRDPRNPIVSCIVEPSTGHETDDPAPLPDGLIDPVEASGPGVLIVGGGPAGLEAARVAAAHGHRVRLAEREAALGLRSRFPVERSGNANLAGFTAWLSTECKRLGVSIETGHPVDGVEVGQAESAGERVIIATGSLDGSPTYELAGAARGRVLSAADLYAHWARSASGEPVLPDEEKVGDDERRVVVLDPIGAQVGVGVAEALALRSATTVHLVTQDNLAGNELARTGDLAPANARLQQLGVHIERRTIVRRIDDPDPTAGGPVGVVCEDRFTAEQRTIVADWVVDAGFRLPDEELWLATGGTHLRAGDCVAPRTVHESVLEARRAATRLAERVAT